VHDDVTRLREEFHKTTDAFLQLHQFMQEMIAKVKTQKEYMDEDLCDLGFFCRELSKVSDELRKEGNAKTDLIGAVLAERRIRATITDPSMELIVRGAYSTGSPFSKTQGAVPKHGSPEYKALCAHYGVPESAIKSGLFSVNFTRLANILTEEASEGRKTPPGVLKTYTKFGTSFRTRR